MLSMSKVDRVLSLFSMKKSYRTISRESGVSRRTVKKITEGLHTLQQSVKVPCVDVQSEELELPEESAFCPTKPVRCGECGAKIILLPCVACTVRKVQRK